MAAFSKDNRGGGRMINVKIYKDGLNYIGFEIDGHAGYASKGNDIICAGVSAVSQLVVEQLNMFSIKHTLNIKDGYMHVMVKKSSYTAGILIESLHQVLTEIQQQYPKYISVSVYVAILNNEKAHNN